jgi:ATP-binding cassette, subfamily C, bacterial
MKTTTLWNYLSILVRVMPRQVLLAVTLMLLVSFTNGIGLLVLLPILQLVGLEVTHGAMGQLADFVAAAFDALNIPLSLGIVLGAYVLVISFAALLHWWSTLVTASLEYEFAARLRAQLYAAIVRTDWPFFARSRSSNLMHVLTTETSRVIMATGSLLGLLVATLTGLVYVGFALLVSPAFTMLVFIVGLSFFLAFRRHVKLAHTIGSEIVQANEQMYGAISENLAGMKVTKSHGLESPHVDSFANLVARVARLYVASARNRANVGFWQKTGSTLVLAIFVYVALAVFNLSAAALLLLLYLFARIVPKFSSVQRQYQSLLSNLPGFDAVMQLQARCEAAAERGSTDELPVRLSHAVQLEQVRYRYDRDNASGWVLDDVNLTLRAGKTTAIVGPSGGGKSTLADLLIGLLTPNAGRILVDSHPLTPERLRSWRAQLGYVPQDAFMFHDTVRANLLAMRPEASDEELWQALRLASAAEFVGELPDGLETVLGDRGIRVSGGERQRLALARALLRRPTLLVLDEATSSLDAENEKRIQHAIEGLHGKMTILIIAHRLSTVRKADMIHVLERGRLVESGDWETLAGKEEGRFRLLCVEQGLILEPSGYGEMLTPSSGAATSPG